MKGKETERRKGVLAMNHNESENFGQLEQVQNVSELFK